MTGRQSESAALLLTVEELDVIAARLTGDDPTTRDARRLVNHIRGLRSALEDTFQGIEIACNTCPRIRDVNVLEARVDALREAAQLIRDGAGAERLDQIASEAEQEWTTFEELAEELGIDLDALRREDSQ